MVIVFVLVFGILLLSSVGLKQISIPLFTTGLIYAVLQSAGCLVCFMNSAIFMVI